VPSPLSRLLLLSSAQREQFEMFLQMLLAENRTLNLTTITNPEEVRARHFEDSLAAVPLIEQMAAAHRLAPQSAESAESGLSLMDVGSGAGFPGLPLAIALPWCRVTSLEATGKKARFQEKVVAALGLRNVTVIHGRAESLAHRDEYREAFDVAAARALATLPVVAELALPFVKVGGHAIAWKGPGADPEIAPAQAACEKLGGATITQFPYILPDIHALPDVHALPDTHAIPGIHALPDVASRAPLACPGPGAEPSSEPASGPSSAPPSGLRLIVFEKTGFTPPLYPRPAHLLRKRPLGGA